MYYDTATRSRQYFSALNVVFPFGIGFYLWQVILEQGLYLVEMNSAQSDSFGLDVLAKALIWGSPLYAFFVCAAFMGAAWSAAKALNFSLGRRVQNLKLGVTMFIAGLLLSFLGILANVSDKPPFDIVYHPILEAINR
ncbi:hypothetical protein [Pacificibacter sp. AS14]|uniref:hypothetical protein n=1 Tax=Pacificibacter sp. AS14 TaxID=3135785 RepID=UPI00317940BB